MILDKKKLVVIPIVIYLIWVLATYLLEGRINLLQKPDPLGRLTYAVVANIAIGTVIAIWLLKPSISSGFLTIRQLGFQSIKRILIVVTITGVIGFVLFVVQRPVTFDPVVVLNIFAQTLPGSIAEVVVCWAAIGTTFESIARNKGRIISIIFGAAIATILFGVYHFAHSPPFNEPGTVLFLMYPGILTSLVYFIGRDIYAAIIFHNFQALFGVMMNVNVASFTQPAYPILILAIASMLALVISDLLLIRKRMKRPSNNFSGSSKK
jgi:membrane protease YdiL (CAAX protease family)